MTETPDPKPATRVWVRLLLFASLALNLLIVGAVVGLSWKFRDGPDQVGRDYAAPYVFALQPKERRSLRRAARDHLPEPVGPRAQRQADYQQVLRALRATPFDRDEAAAALTRQTSMARDRRVAGQEALLDHWDAMSDSRRAAYATRLEEVLKKGGRRPPRPDGKKKD